MLLGLLWVCCLYFAVSTEVKVEIVHTQNTRGQIQAIDSNEAECYPVGKLSDFNLCYGGMARKLTYVKDQRVRATADVNTTLFVVDGGNFAFGSIWFNAFNGKAASDIGTLFKYDVMGLANNEFLIGTSWLHSFMRNFRSSTTFVASNINWDASSDLLIAFEESLLSNYFVSEKNGIALGFVGIVSPKLQFQADIKNMKDISVIPFISAIRKAIDAAKLANPSVLSFVLIDASFDQYEQETLMYMFPEITVALVPKLTVLPNTYIRPFLKSNGKYGIFVCENAKGIGHLKLVYDTVDGSLLSWDNSESLDLNSTFANDTALWKMQADLSTDLVTWKSKPIGYLNSSFPLIRQTLRSNNATTLGKFVGDALLAGCPGCSIVAANAGGIRGVGLQAGLVTYGDVVTLVPFGNWLVTFKIRGDLLLEVLQYSVSQSIGLDFGGRLIWGGLVYSYNPNALESGKLIVEVQIRNPQTNQLEAFSPNAFYTMGVNNFIFGGGDGFDQFSKGFASGQILNVNQFGVPELTAMINYFMSFENSVVPAYPDFFTLCDQQATDAMRNGFAIRNDIPISQVCPSILSTSTVDLLRRCKTDTTYCTSRKAQDISSLLASLVGEDVVFINTNEVLGDVCDTCSGVGSCSNLRCQCSFPDRGLWMNRTDLFQGELCNEVVTPFTYSVASIFITSVCLLFSIVSAAYYAYHGKNIVFRRSSPLFCQIINAGSALACIASYQASFSFSEASCFSIPTLCCFAFILQFGALFIKNHRVNRIFNNKKLKVIKLTDGHLVLMLCGLILLETLLVVFVFLMEPSRLNPLVLGQEAMNSCVSRSGYGYGYILLLVANGFFLFWGCYLSYQTRNVVSDFNESFYIFLAIYQFAFTVAASLPVLYIFSKYSITGYRITVSLCITVPTTSVSAILFVNKFKGINSPPSAITPPASKQVKLKIASDADTELHHSSPNAGNDLAEEVHDLKKEVFDLKNELFEKEEQILELTSQLELMKNKYEPPIPPESLPAPPSKKSSAATFVEMTRRSLSRVRGGTNPFSNSAAPGLKAVNNPLAQDLSIGQVTVITEEGDAQEVESIEVSMPSMMAPQPPPERKQSKTLPRLPPPLPTASKKSLLPPLKETDDHSK